MPSLANSSRYTKFVRARNKVLEDFHRQAQLNMSKVIGESILAIRDITRSRYPDIMRYGVYAPQGKELLSNLEFTLKRLLGMACHSLTFEMTHLRGLVYSLTYSSEAEAIGQAINKPTKYSLTSDKIFSRQRSETFSGGDIEQRVQLILNKLIRKIMSAIELSAINEDSLEDMADRVERVLPKPKRISAKGRHITVGGVRESDKPKEDVPDMSTGYIDPQTWEEIVDTYKSEEVPGWRGPEDSYKVQMPSGKYEEIYAWELEQEVTQDFVYQVRQGQIDAAKENGINDYVWIAIVDDRTDDCCVWRDGLTTAEIEQKLSSTRRDDKCQSIVPPAHFNCRCILAPMVDEMPDRPESNEKDFESWLNT